MKKSIDVLKACPLFYNIDEEDIYSILNCLSAKIKTYDKESYIYVSGDYASNVGIVLKGSVHVIKEDFWGNRAILAKLTSSDMFGETFACIDSYQLPISVVASEQSEIMFVDYKRILKTCSSACVFHFTLIQNMVQVLANKNIMLTQKLEHIVKRTTREKILSYLSSQAIRAQNNSFKIPFNRQELADYLSVDRSAMSNELSKLQNEGILSFHKNEFTLKNID